MKKKDQEKPVVSEDEKIDGDKKVIGDQAGMWGWSWDEEVEPASHREYALF